MKSPQPTPLENEYWRQVKRITWRLLWVWIALILSVVLFIPQARHHGLRGSLDLLGHLKRAAFEFFRIGCVLRMAHG